MSPSDVQKFLDAEPFRPFQVEHRDGRRWDVRHRADAQPFRARLIVAVDHDPETGVAETVEYLGWDRIRTVRPIESRVAA